MRKIAGSKGEARYASAGLERSTASVYWTRSFVPMLKNSASRANTSAMIAADGTSTIMPSGMCAARGLTARASTSDRAARGARELRAARRSEATIGIMMRTSPWAEARTMARSWVRKTSGRASARRTARRPSAGFISSGTGSVDANLSPPMSNVRSVTGSGAIASTTRGRSRTARPPSGGCGRSM